MRRHVICLFLSLCLILNVLSVGAYGKKTETDYSLYVVPVEYADRKGNTEELSLMVLDSNVYVNAEQLVNRFGYDFNIKDGKVAVSNTKNDSLPKGFTIFSIGKPEVNQLYNHVLVRYNAPCACKEINGVIYVPFIFTLLMLNSSMLIQDDVLLIEMPHKDLLDIYSDIFMNKDKYGFNFMTDFGYTDKDIRSIWGGSRLSTVWNGVLSNDLTSWAALFQAFSDSDTALDTKYGKSLATCLCTESDEELKATTDNARAFGDMFEKGKLGEALQAKSDEYEDALETFTKTGEQYLKEIKKGNSEYILKYNQNYKAMEDVFEKQDKFEKIGGNVLDIQKKMPIDMSFLEYASYLTEAVSYANEFQNQDEFSVTAVDTCVHIDENTSVLEKNVKTSIKNYTKSLKGNEARYIFSNFLWNNIGEFAINKTPIAEMFGPQANIELALWNIASSVIPFISNGLDGGEKFELALYASFFQNLMCSDFNTQYSNVINNIDNATPSDDLYMLSQTCYTYIKSCYIARNAGIGSLIAKRESVREAVQPLIDEQTTINREIADILAEIKKVEEVKRDGNSHVFGFLPRDNKKFLNENTDDSMLDFLNSLSSKEVSEKKNESTKKSSDDNVDNETLYLEVINDLENQFGKLRLTDSIIYPEEDDKGEVNGVCYIGLLNMDKRGAKELFVVCKNEEQKDYIGKIYSIQDEAISQVFDIDNIAINNNDFYFYIDIRSYDGKDFVLVSGQNEGKVFYRIYGNTKGNYRCSEYSYSQQDLGDNEFAYTYYLNGTEIGENNFDEGLAKWGLALNYSSGETMIYGLRGNRDDVEYDLLASHIEKAKREIMDNNYAFSIFSGSEWKDAYLQFIQSDKYAEDDLATYGYIYLDFDHIPEIVIDYGTMADGTRIISYQNGKVVDVLLNGKNGCSYIEKKGVIYNDYSHMGVGSDTIYSLTEDGFTILGEGKKVAIDEYSTKYNYEWGGHKVSEELYYKNIDEIFDISRSVRIEDTIWSRSSICDDLTVH